MLIQIEPERQRPAYRRGRVRWPSLELVGELGHVGKPLGGIDRDRATERRLQPGREIRAKSRDIPRPPADAA